MAKIQSPMIICKEEKAKKYTKKQKEKIMKVIMSVKDDPKAIRQAELITQFC